jgi:hypothetical protein
VISGGGLDTSLYFTNQTANSVQLPPVGQAIDIMGLISRASDLFMEQTAAEQRRLL